MKYRFSDYILPILAPLMVYVVILVGFVWQHHQNNQERVRFRMVEAVNLLLVNVDFDTLSEKQNNTSVNDQLTSIYQQFNHQEKLPQALAIDLINFSRKNQFIQLSNKEQASIAQSFISGAPISSPKFISSSNYWHYLSPLNERQALLLTLNKSDSQFAWFNDQSMIMRVVLLTFAVILLMLFAFRKYIRISVEQAKELQKHAVTVKTREIMLMHQLTASINQLDNLAQAAQEIKRDFPQIFPGYSGSVLFCDNTTGALRPFGSWGRNSAYTSKVLISKTWFKNEARREYLNQYYTLRNRSLIVALINDDQQYGAIHLKHDKHRISKDSVEHILKFVSQLNIALINLQLKNDLKEKVIRDPLTNLYNRRFLSEALEKSLSGAIRYKSTLALLMIDLDYFKQLNDTHGHDAGDKVLKLVADVFKHNLRMSDVACRYGGEEFCIICPDTNLREAYLLAEKIRVLVENLVVSHQSKQIEQLTTSIGIAMYPRNGVTSTRLLHLADQALYQAKHLGRNMVYVSDVEEQHQDQVNKA
ncbi:GGDEF domain-containing protein [Thalassotalea sp. LPB0316]|uniref:GGDEF domain-containing protein n=1 Tax=Thalassotalea sp. LPB0316 TaxID=2769490 RepID=UPI001865BC3B|nr:GGDEF domain-containing protein [Thalassotalea sp. LPB0316]QOL26289.1 GGDEF domain-containing protein [Thalassotalea sp. LPB0316]